MAKITSTLNLLPKKIFGEFATKNMLEDAEQMLNDAEQKQKNAKQMLNDAQTAIDSSKEQMLTNAEQMLKDAEQMRINANQMKQNLKEAQIEAEDATHQLQELTIIKKILKNKECNVNVLNRDAEFVKQVAKKYDLEMSFHAISNASSADTNFEQTPPLTQNITLKASADFKLNEEQKNNLSKKVDSYEAGGSFVSSFDDDNQLILIELKQHETILFNQQKIRIMQKLLQIGNHNAQDNTIIMDDNSLYKNLAKNLAKKYKFNISIENSNGIATVNFSKTNNTNIYLTSLDKQELTTGTIDHQKALLPWKKNYSNKINFHSFINNNGNLIIAEDLNTNKIVSGNEPVRKSRPTNEATKESESKESKQKNEATKESESKESKQKNEATKESESKESKQKNEATKESESKENKPKDEKKGLSIFESIAILLSIIMFAGAILFGSPVFLAIAFAGAIGTCVAKTMNFGSLSGIPSKIKKVDKTKKKKEKNVELENGKKEYHSAKKEFFKDSAFEFLTKKEKKELVKYMENGDTVDSAFEKLNIELNDTNGTLKSKMEGLQKKYKNCKISSKKQDEIKYDALNNENQDEIKYEIKYDVLNNKKQNEIKYDVLNNKEQNEIKFVVLNNESKKQDEIKKRNANLNNKQDENSFMF
ncbi:MAG: hypothetical protein RR008_02610 [Clostridia bacterium]